MHTLPPVPAASLEPLDTHASFTTPEHISFRFRLAGPMLRMFAYLLDLIIRVAILWLLAMLFAFAGFSMGNTGAFGVGTGIFLFCYFLLDWFFGAFCEWIWKGSTPGKKAVGIRVVGHDGLPAGFGACVLRNLLRSADFLPFGFCIGVITMVFSGRFQRLGDLAAGTLVVYNERTLTRHLAKTKDRTILERAEELPPAIADALDGATLRAITSYIERRRRFGPARRNEMAAHVAEPLRQRFEIDHRWTDDDVLCAVYVRCFQLAESGGAARAARIIAKRERDWNKLDELISEKPRGNLVERTLNLSRLYRSTCADLALATAYHLPAKQVGFLHDLVARSHLAYYRRIVISWRQMLDNLMVRVPGLMYGDACTRIALLTFFGTFFASMLLGHLRPEMATAYVGQDTIDNMREMYADSPKGREFFAASTMSGFYILNNVGISLSCFAAGIFFGVGSLVYLVFNGLFLGLIFGFMTTVDSATRSHFFEFVSAHGPFELTGIALSGAAGMHLGLGLVVRKGLPWIDSLRLAAAKSLVIIAVAASFVALAAPIEAFVSPSDLSLGGKRLVMLLCGILIIIYMVILGRLGRRELNRRELNGVESE